MKIRYETITGRLFDDEALAIKYEKNISKIKEYFDILVDIDFFQNYKVPLGKGYTDLGKRSGLGIRKSDWRYNFMGYTQYYGRMGDGDQRITFKLRKNNLLILRYTDDLKVQYLGKINMDDIILKINADKYNV
jgi:hypothetical protein